MGGSALGPAARSRLVVPLAAVSLLPLLAYALRPAAAPLAAVLLLAGLAHAYTIGLDRWWVDAVPEELRGRAMTLLSTGLMTLQGAGMALAGLAAELVPVHLVVVGAAVLGTLCVLVLLGELRATGARRDDPRDGHGDGHRDDRPDGQRRGPKGETGLNAK